MYVAIYLTIPILHLPHHLSPKTIFPDYFQMFFVWLWSALFVGYRVNSLIIGLPRTPPPSRLPSSPAAPPPRLPSQCISTGMSLTRPTLSFHSSLRAKLLLVCPFVHYIFNISSKVWFDCPGSNVSAALAEK